MPELSRRSFLQSTATSAVLAPAIQGVPVLALAATAEHLEVGVATRDITPPPGLPLWGYSDAERIAEGTLSPLYCKAIVFRAGTATVGLVVLDLGRMPRPEQCERIRAEVRAQGIQHVIFSATHTHSAPFMDLDLPHVEPTLRAITETLGEAAAALQPARIGVGRANIDISHNRRVIREGVCYMMWRNAARKPTSPVDHEAAILRIDRMDGAPLATLVHYACHPVVFGPDNKQYSADWPGAMCARVKAATGAECFFLQGGAGDINPYLDKTPIAAGGVEAMEAEGAKAAEAVIAAHPGIKTDPSAHASLAYREELIDVGTRWDLDEPAQVRILQEAYTRMYEVYMAPFAKDPRVPLGVLVINNQIALPCLPGEFFVQFQRDMKERSPLPNTFLCGYTNEFHIYFPTIKDAAIGGYGASTATYVAVGAGEKVVNRALVMVGEMTGQFRPLRGPEDFQIKELSAE